MVIADGTLKSNLLLPEHGVYAETELTRQIWFASELDETLLKT